MRPLRDYQGALASAARAAYARRPRQDERGYGVLIQLPTGGGKTRIGEEFILQAMSNNLKVLWIAHRKELLAQIRDVLWDDGVRSIRVARSGRIDGDPDAAVTVASIQTLRAKEYQPHADLVIFDEARHYGAPDWGALAGCYGNAIRIGLDATPATADDRPLVIFDALVQGPSVAWLQEHDPAYLVPCTTIAPNEYLGAMAFGEATANEPASRRAALAPVDAWWEHAAGKPTIVFCDSIAHAEAVAAAFREWGVEAEMVNGDPRRAKQRDTAIERFKRGELTVLTNCFVLTEGTDLPLCECIIVARGCSAESAWLQMGGRGLRLSPETGKTELILIDMFGHIHVHGLLEDERHWSLTERRAVRRVTATGETLPPLRQCAACFAWTRAGKACPRCGLIAPPPPPPKMKRADLAIVHAKATGETDEERILWLDARIAEELRARRNPFRARHPYKAKYGAYPPRDWILTHASRQLACPENVKFVVEGGRFQ